MCKVEERLEAAKRIKELYGFRKAAKVKGVAAAAAALDRAAAAAATGSRKGSVDPWERIWGVQTDADVALKWLQHQTKPQGIDPALLRAEFVAVFPGH